MAAPTRVLRTTCPRDCYDACGIEVLIRGDNDVRVRGDRDHEISRGKLCRKCTAAYNGVYLDPSARLTTPLRRTGPKGTGAFAPLSWDAALGEIAARLSPLVDADAAHTIINTHYTGTFSVLGYLFPQRFFNRLGATEVDPDSVCNKAGHVALDYVYGDSLEGFDPRTASASRTVVVWGANPSVSAPHQHDFWLPESGAEVIVVDPIRTATAKQADLHLQVRPGADAALAFALLHVIERDGLVDHDFLAQHAIGFDELQEQLADCSPAWGERTTGVPASDIERAAHAYGEGPSLLWIGQGLQRQPTGGNIVRACAMLPAVTGNLGRPGTGFLYLNGFENRGIDEPWVMGTHLAAKDVPRISHMDLADQLADPTATRALICWNINIAASNPQQRQLKEALRREDLFTVVVDMFPTDTADFADIVLPAASFLEFDDVVASYFHRSLSAQQQVIEPMGEALPNTEIFRRLAAAMGFTEPELFESDEAMIERIMRDADVGLSFAELCAKGTVWPSAEPVVQHAALTFRTPSGRIELASEQAASDGHPRTPVPTIDAPPSRDKLRLLTPASEWTLNDSYANDVKIGRRLGRPTVYLNPRDAEARGLADGQEVTVRSVLDAIQLVVAVTDDVPTGVAYAPKGRWPKLDPNRANINVLNPGSKADMGESSSVHAVEVTVSG